MRTHSLHSASVKKSSRGIHFVCAMFWLIATIFFSTSLYSQTTPSNCVQGCTSNDVQIKNAYLSDASGNKLTNSFICPQNGSATVYLTLELTTNTPRIGVSIFVKIRQLLPADATHPEPYPGGEVTGSPVSECFGKTLNQPTNKVTFTQTFTWTCGTPIVMTDVFLGWGTGNTNFCGTLSAPFKCPATPSKCYQLPGDKFIAIQTPSTNTASQTKCESSAGSGTATFDLAESDNDVKGSQTNVTVKWYSDAAGTTEITRNINGNVFYTSGSGSVYAKVCGNTSPFPCSELQSVTLTVKSKPAAPVLSKVDNCNGTTTITAKDAGNNNISASELTWSGTSQTGNPIIVSTTAAITATRTVNGCTSAASTSVTPAPKTAPGTPALTKVDNCNGTTTITAKDAQGNVLNASELTWSNGANTNPISVTTTTAITCTRTVNGCTSNNSNTINPAPGSAPPKPIVSITEPSLCGTGTATLTVTNPQAGATYTLTQASGGINPNPVLYSGGTLSFSGLVAGKGYSITADNGGCPSNTASCADNSVTQKLSSDQMQETTLQSQPAVKAYPNPFNDRVKFAVNSPDAGSGSLEIYNMLGQKIKTVYQGRINAGNQTFELTIPKKQQSTLVYIFRVGGKQVTGKLLQLND
jgi:hypothetical protein